MPFMHWGRSRLLPGLLFLVLTLSSIPLAAPRGRGRQASGHSCGEFFDATSPTKQGGLLERGYGVPGGARLGNHLFMYASAFGVAYANGMQLQHRPWPPLKRAPHFFPLLPYCIFFSLRFESYHFGSGLWWWYFFNIFRVSDLTPQ